MKTEQSAGSWVREQLAKSYQLKQLDLGADARMSRKGITFETESYEVSGLGHLCTMRMKAMFGLMRMEAVILSVTHKDVPMINLDYVKAMGKETQMVELYNTQIADEAKELQEELQKIRDRDADLTDYVSPGTHWYDDILYPCSYRKTGKGVSDRLAAAARDCAGKYISMLASAPDCDPAEKQAKARHFAESLLASGGPAVDQVTRLFGRETAERLILRHMYGVR